MSCFLLKLISDSCTKETRVQTLKQSRSCLAGPTQPCTLSPQGTQLHHQQNSHIISEPNSSFHVSCPLPHVSLSVSCLSNSYSSFNRDVFSSTSQWSPAWSTNFLRSLTLCQSYTQLLAQLSPCQDYELHQSTRCMLFSLHGYYKVALL